MTVEDYIRRNMKGWIRETIIPEIKSAAQAAGGTFPTEQFMNALELRGSFGKGYSVYNDWNRTDRETGKPIPLAKFFEYGTADHDMAARLAPFMVWQDKKTGRWRSSKYHWVTGIPETLVMHNGVQNGLPKLKRLISQKVKEYAERERKKNGN